MRSLSFIDRLILQADNALHTLVPGASRHANNYPGEGKCEPVFDEAEQKHLQGLMRINHCGEVCAQALYQGQALTAKLPEVRLNMEEAALEEVDHLAWCEQRLAELGSRPSISNPLWYGLSFALGAFAGAAGDKYSLGFVAATEERVSDHLRDHLQQLPKGDEVDQAILATMLEDEERHATNALEAGGLDFPESVKSLMAVTAKLMTATTYRI